VALPPPTPRFLTLVTHTHLPLWLTLVLVKAWSSNDCLWFPVQNAKPFPTFNILTAVRLCADSRRRKRRRNKFVSHHPAHPHWSYPHNPSSTVINKCVSKRDPVMTAYGSPYKTQNHSQHSTVLSAVRLCTDSPRRKRRRNKFVAPTPLTLTKVTHTIYPPLWLIFVLASVIRLWLLMVPRTILKPHFRETSLKLLTPTLLSDRLNGYSVIQ
jgi:hypothetical protein